MIKTLRQITKMKTALWVNAFFYYWKRLWLVGRWVPDSVYANAGLKNVLSVLAAAVRLAVDFTGKPLYLLCFVWLPYLALSQGHTASPGQGVAFLAQALFFLNGILGSLSDSQIFTVTRDKITCIKYLHMDARSYLQGFLAFRYVPFFLSWLLWLPLAARLLGGTLLQGVFLWLMLFACRMLGEAFQLWLFDRTGKVISRNMAYSWAVIAIGLAGAYVPAALGWRWPLAAVLLHPAAAVLWAALGAACLWYIAVGYRGYGEKFHRSLDLGYLLSTLLKASAGSSSSFKEIQLQEKDAAISAGQRAKFQGLRGYAYLNALFFARHRRQLAKPVYYRLAAAALLFAAGAWLAFNDRETALKVAGNLTVMLPFFVYIMYFMTVADKATRAMFYNCDKEMLRYAYYRQPQTVLKTFRIRLLRVSLYDLTIAAGVCLAAAGFRLLCGLPLFSADLLLFCAAILLLAVLFTAHHLCLYYLFQPYSESLQVKNPFFSVVNTVMFLLCLLCLQIETGGPAFTVTVLVFTALYIAAALVLVYRLAPRTFRIK